MRSPSLVYFQLRTYYLPINLTGAFQRYLSLLCLPSFEFLSGNKMIAIKNQAPGTALIIVSFFLLSMDVFLLFMHLVLL